MSFQVVAADRLKELRKAKGVSQEAVASAVGVSTSAYCMYESGRRVPRDRIKIALAKYYNKSVQSIFFRE